MKYIIPPLLLFFLFLFSCSTENEEQKPEVIDTSEVIILQYNSSNEETGIDSIALEKRRKDSIKFANNEKERIKEYKRKTKIHIVKDPQIRKTDKSVTFKLSDVKPASKSLAKRSYKWAIQSKPVHKIE
jgi:hypothetical protein